MARAEAAAASGSGLAAGESVAAPAGRDASTAKAAWLEVEVVYCPAAGQVDLQPLRLSAGTTVRQAIDASGLLQRHALDPATLVVGVWGRICELHRALRARDRVEIYRPLTVDPKEARRLRYKRHRAAAKPAAGPRAAEGGVQLGDPGAEGAAEADGRYQR